MKTNKFYYNDYGNKIRIGYSIFRYHNNKLWSLAERSFEMFYSIEKCCIFNDIPIAYFRPQEGDFIIKTSRQYSDLEIIKYAKSKSNYLWKIKK